MEYVMKHMVQNELKRQKKLLENYKRRYEKVKALEGCKLEISIKDGRTYYYEYVDGKRKYLGNAKNKMVHDIQELYLCKDMMQLVTDNIRELEDFLNLFQWITPELVRSRLPKCYIPTDLNLSLMEGGFAKKWRCEMQKIKDAYPVEHPEHLSVTTCDGTKVRSRAEAMLYDMFVAMGFTVLYEFPVWIDGKLFHPDFTLLHPYTHNVYFWEHLGMWYREDARGNYRRGFLHKAEQYEKIGFYLGNNLLTSYEYKGGGINMNWLQDRCRSLLLRTKDDQIAVDAKTFIHEQRKHLEDQKKRAANGSKK